MRVRTFIAPLFVLGMFAWGAPTHATVLDSEIGEIMGMVKGEDSHFQIADSDYLNISLDSTEIIKLRMESVPEMITVMIEPSDLSIATSTQIILSGLAAETTYYKYEDNYHHLTEFVTNESGTYPYVQDVSKPHLVFIQPRHSTKFIKDDSIGGDCALIGIWNNATKTCTLNADLTETVQIDSDGITLDGGGHTTNGSRTGSGVYLYARSGVTVKNLVIKNFSYGIYSNKSPRSILDANTFLNNFQAVALYGSDSNSLRGNVISIDVISQSRYQGIVLSDSNNNLLDGNSIAMNKNMNPGRHHQGIVFFDSYNNTITNNLFSNINEAFLLFDSDANKIYHNNFINNGIHVITYNGTTNVFNLPMPNGGNYWDTFDDFAEGCADTSGDGICDTPYIFTSGRYTLPVNDTLPWTKQDGWKNPPDPCAAPGACASNILFLPGIEASRLYRPDYAGGTDKLWEPASDADARDLLMNPDGTAARDDIYTRDVIDNAYLPLKGNVYKSFLEQLETMKTEEHAIDDYTAVPYDWRLSLDDILTNGALLSQGRLYYSGPLGATSTPYIIQELRRLAGDSRTGKVTIVAHSNGGLLAKALTDKLGAEAAELIDKIIFVAVPQAGTPQAVGALLHGYEQSLPIKPLSLFGMTEATARELARNMPGVYNLLPSENYFTHVDDPVIRFSDDSLLASWRTAYAPDGVIHSGERLHTFVTDQSRATLPVSDALVSPIIGNETLLNASETLHNTLDSWTPPAGISLIEIAGWGEETLATIDYYAGSSSECVAFKADSTCSAMVTSPVLEYSPKTVLDGDGTVLVPSALWTSGTERYWVDLRNYNKWWLNGNIPRKHADILEVPELRTFIQNIVTNTNINQLPDFVLTSAPPNENTETQLRFTLHSPLALNLYDNLGNHTGLSTTTNSLEENIPGSRYLTFGEVQYISVPASTYSRLIMDGYEDGSFTLDMEETQGDAVLAATTFSGIPSFEDTKVTIDISSGAGIEGASNLFIDVQGDGMVDIELEPKLGGTVILPMPLTVTAEHKKITFGEPLPPLTASITDALGVVVTGDFSGAPDCTTTATQTSPAGTYPITCSVGTLLSEKYEFSTFVPGALTIQYKWDGFLQPINDTAHQAGQNASVFKGGSTIPVKFQLKKSDGTLVQSATAPVWLAPQPGASMSASVDEPVYSAPATTGSVYKWDSIAQQYVYNWNTKGLATARWYQVSAQLDDGNTYSVTVGLK